MTIPPQGPITSTSLRDYQARAVAEWESAPERAVCIVAPTGCHAKGAGILLADGRVAPVETIAVGDRLMGADGPRTVTMLHSGEDDMYRVTPTKGEPFVVNGGHILSLMRTQDGTGKALSITDVSVREYLGWAKWSKHTHKLFRAPVRHFDGEAAVLPLSPYFLGAMLGDGSMRFTPAITTADPEVLDECGDVACAHGLSVNLNGKKGKASTYYLSGRHGSGDKNPITNKLRELGLRKRTCHNKFIPHVYKTASVSSRLDVLAGLLDTDGHHTHGGFDYISKSPMLARDVAFIARSVGLAAYVVQCTKSAHAGHVGTYYRVSISGDCSIIPCRIPRKKAAKRLQKKNHLVTGFRVEPVGRGEFFGFEVDGDRRYLMGDFTVTHNSGKSVMGREIASRAVSQGARVLWLAHRIELLTQAVGHLSRVNVPAGIIAAGHDREPHAPVQCASVDTLLARPNDRPPADLIVWDEAHHLMADTYRMLPYDYPAARIVGLTATPQRQDGKPLGDIFERLIVAAQYSELLTAGHIAPCRVFRPEEHLGSDLACPPLEAYQKWGNGERGFGFANSVQSAHTLAREFTEAGIPSAAIDGRMSDADRAAALRAFTAGHLRILWNMHVLTEGVDVPDASVCILARNPGHAGGYLQAVGRVLRTHPGKTTARLIDLTGCSHKHGLPTSDREYALNGRAIRCAEEPVRNCAECGCTYPQASDSCPECGAEPKREPRKLPRIWSLELREAFESDNVTADHKTNEWYRLVSLCEQRGWSLTWAVKQYAGLFQESPPIERVTPEQRTRELARLIRDAATRGHKTGAAAHRYKAIFGVFPSRFMTAQAQGHSR